jgi:hypothetical protein
MKRGIVLSDLHCGHFVGLTPPEHQGGDAKAHQRAYWRFYAEQVRKFAPYDFVFVNGDCIDGKGLRSGGVEQLTTNRQTQALWAAQALRLTQSAKTKYVFTFGTDYHTGADGEDFEKGVADTFNAKIGAHEWVNVNGCVFDLKHHCGSSNVPHTRHTPVAREHLWNLLWSESGEQPHGDILLRSHVHHFNHCGGKEWLAMTTPALQGLGTRFGSRRCSGTVDYGFIVFEVDEKGDYRWHPVLLDMAQVKARVNHIK